jgi:hypothetical protein
MKRGSTHFLRLALSLAGIGVLALCIFALPSLWKGGSEEFPAASNAFLIIMTSLYIAAIPFFLALWQTFKLLNYIDQNTAISNVSVKVLKNIKYYAIVITALFILDVPFLVPIAEADDAPGLVVIGMLVACAPIVVAVFAAILQRLLQNAIDIKSENDLTV